MKIGILARRTLVRAYGAHPGLQSLSYDEVERYLTDGTLEQHRIITPTSVTTLASGGTRISAGCRIHHGRDRFPGETPLMHAALAAGDIVITDEILNMPGDSLPDSHLVRIADDIRNGRSVHLGEIVDVDDALSESTVSGITRTRTGVSKIAIAFHHPDHWTTFDRRVRDEIAMLQERGITP